ncbi:MAG: aquaporin [Candidatus Dormibacteraeota bacterium]|nr:aquaporin [Candidatus Dormibacteraeota bacterium]
MRFGSMRLRALVAEFIGTFALIFIGVGSIAVGAITKDPSVVGVALAHGLTIMVMVSALGVVSGGHFNPAVSVAALVARRIDPITAISYIVVQLLGGIAGALADKAVFPGAVLDSIGLGTPMPGHGINATGALVLEIILTFFLMVVIFGTAIDARAPRLGGLFIGLTITLDILAAGPLTGAAMNPARALGPALVSGNLGSVWIYFAGPLAGALLAALYYRAGLEEPTAEGLRETAARG